jgi:hypothetical protein
MLKADSCKIRKLQSGAFNGLTLLTILSLESNDITEIIPGTFEMISRLEYLHLQYNKIKHLAYDAFRGLVNLQHVNLEGNKLHYLHPDTFLGLKNLQTLYLSNNPDLQIPTDRHFINSHSLTDLDISACNVSSVTFETFANVSALEWLGLHNNYLRSIDISVLEVLPKLSNIYLHKNRLQCDCQLQEVWQWCQDHNLQTSYEEMVPICDTPSEVKGIWWGVLGIGQCLESNIQYYGDYKSISHSYTPIEDMDTETKTDTDIENDQRSFISSFLDQNVLPLSLFILIFGTLGNVILIIIITCNKDMRTVPNMYILNLAVSDVIYLMVFFFDALRYGRHVTWLDGEFGCAFFAFCCRMSVGLTAYSVAVLSIQRYRVTVNPLQVHVSSQPTWRGTGAIICGVWIVAALFSIPAARSKISCSFSKMLWLTNYYNHDSLFRLLVSCVIPLCVIAFSYIMTARHLVEDTCSLSEKKQNPRLNTRQNTAKVVLGLTVVFLISYLPLHITETYLLYSMDFHIPSAEFDDKFYLVFTLLDTRSILKYFLSINSCLNPVALFCTSLAFRRHFKRYLTC